MPSKLIESLRGNLETLRKARAITEATMRRFNTACPPPASGVRDHPASDARKRRLPASDRRV